MKKVLFATTALIATAGVAAADVNLSGLARFGILYTDTAVAPAKKTRIEARFRLNIDASAESDNGLTFGARLRMQADDTANGAMGATFIADPRFSVASGGLEVGVGNINGAIASMPGLFAGSIGLSGLGWGNVVSNFASDTFTSSAAARNGVEVIYSAGSFGVHLSYSETTAQAAVAAVPGNAGKAAVAASKRTALAVSYNINDWTVALGYQDSAAAADVKYVLTAGGKLGSFDLGVAFAQANNGNNSATLSGAFAAGSATTVTAYIAMDEGKAEKNTYGVGVVHNLGGGASIRGGVASNHGSTLADLGLQFNF